MRRASVCSAGVFFGTGVVRKLIAPETDGIE